MKQTVFRGSCVALVTPMHADGSIHLARLRACIEVQLAAGTDAILVCGTTGESCTLSDGEHLRIIEAAVQQVRGRVPVIAGTGSNDTQHAIEMSKAARRLGADALLQVTPYYNKTSQAGLVRHFCTIADAAQLPLILYNIPSRTGMRILPQTYQTLARHPQIVATKEAGGDIVSIVKTVALCGDALPLYAGNDDQIAPILALGGLGAISVLANVAPRAVHRLCGLYFSGNAAQGLSLQARLLPLIEALFCDVNPIPVKEALGLLGCEVGPCRMPLAPLSAPDRARLQAELARAMSDGLLEKPNAAPLFSECS